MTHFICLYCHQKLQPEPRNFADCLDCSVRYWIVKDELTRISIYFGKFYIIINFLLNKTFLSDYLSNIMEINKIFWLPPKKLLAKLQTLSSFQ